MRPTRMSLVQEKNTFVSLNLNDGLAAFIECIQQLENQHGNMLKQVRDRDAEL